ncbi:MAG: JAB domain-containing protein [Treponema sp.]|nr:JAB domain-containing protein [Treponema sp.]
MTKKQIKSVEDAGNIVKKYRNKKQENFWALTLDSSHKVIKCHHVSKGVLNRTIVHPRECFYHAIRDNALSVMFAHNHPSGELIPSEEDIRITKMLTLAGKVLGIPVVDHIIVARGNDRVYSFQRDSDVAKDMAKGLSFEETMQFVAEFFSMSEK